MKIESGCYFPPIRRKGQIWIDPVSLSYAVRRRYIFTGGAWHPLSATKADLNGPPLPGDNKFPDEPRYRNTVTSTKEES